MSSRLPFFLALLLLGLTACDSSDPREEPPPVPDSITGNWTGELVSTDLNGKEATFQIAVTLNEALTMVGGSGTGTGPDTTEPFTVVESESSYLHPLLSPVLLYNGPPLGNLSGNVSENRQEIRGTMSGPGFSGIAELKIVLTRQMP